MADCPISLIDAMNLEYRDFTNDDWDAFSGCETADPKIASVDGLTVIREITDDEITVHVYRDSDCWFWFMRRNPQFLD